MSDIDLDAIRAKWLEQCSACDGGLPMACNHPVEDYRPVMLRLVREVDAQAARIDKALATCSKYQAAADVVVHPVRADAWRVLSDHVRRALTEDTT